MNKTFQTILKGYAILFIILHNYCHLKEFGLPQENEMSFTSLNWEIFIQHVTSSPIMLIPDLLSFVGWIGVPVFVFLSGFGLTKKYELSPTYCDRPTTGGVNILIIN